MKQPKNSGFSLMEVAIVLVIIGLVLGGIWAIYASVQENTRTNQAIKQMQVLVENIRTYYHSQPSEIDEAELQNVVISAGLVPADLRNTGTTILTHPWGNDLDLRGINDLTQGRAFWVEWERIPPRACVSLLMNGAASQENSGIVGYAILPTNGADLSAMNFSSVTGLAGLTAAQASLVCSPSNALVVSLQMLFRVQVNRN